MSDTENLPNRRRRWRKWTIWIGVVVLTGILVNGPIFRAIAVWQIERGFAKAGMQGEFEFDGTLVGGARLSDLVMTGTMELKELRIDRAEVDFSVLTALRGKVFEAVDRVEIGGVRIRIETKSEETEASEPKPVNLDFLRLAGARIDVRKMDFELKAHDSGEVVFGFSGLDFQHRPGKDGSLKVDRFVAPGGSEWADLNAAHSWTPDAFALRDLTLTDALILRSLEFSPTPEPAAKLIVEAFEGEFTIDAGPGKKIQARLTAGVADLGEFLTFLGEKPVLGKVTKLDLTIEGASEIALLAEVSEAVFLKKKLRTSASS
ncbi:MAG: hypothetical protein ACI8UO_002064 [Verrucomicrobiales bacterium]|jgi:hypothetical protein